MKLGIAVVLVLWSPASLAQTKNANSETVPVRVDLVDGEGRPIIGASVILGEATELYTADALAKPLTRSDAKGHIRFRTRPYVHRDSTSRPEFVMIAHPRFATVRLPLSNSGYNYTPWGAIQNSSSKYDLGRITMLPSDKITGLVRGKRGRPLAGARVVMQEFLSAGYYGLNYYSPNDPSVIMGACKTDANGRFVLTGVLRQGMAMTITADGYYTLRLSYVDSSRMIDVAMEASGFLSGRVVDGEDKPIDALLYPAFEGRAFNHREQVPLNRTSEDGSFKVTITDRGRYSLRAMAVLKPGGIYRQATSDAYSRPRSGLKIELAAPAEENKPITVEVVDKKTGKPIEAAKAAVIWQDARHLNHLAMENAFRTGAKQVGKDGKVKLPGPLNQQPPQGGVIVKAKGYAPSIKKKVEYDGDKPNELKIEMEPAAIIKGVVVDPATGKPIPRVSVVANPTGMNASQLAMYGYGVAGQGDSKGVLTDAEGRFQIEDLGPGDYEIKARIDGRPESEMQRLKMKIGQIRNDVRIEVPTGVTLSGKVFAGFAADGKRRPAQLHGGWQVRLGGQRQQPGYFYDSWMFMGRIGYSSYSAGSLASADAVPLGDHGSFRFSGLGPERYKLFLIAPPIGLRGSSVSVAIEPIRVRRKNILRDFDISEDLPGVVRGKVKVTGVPIPMGRLLVLSIPIGTATKRPSRIAYNRVYFRCFVDADGTFAFRGARGRHHIWIMDGAASTILFHGDKPVDIQFGKTVAVDYEIPLTRVRVRLVPQVRGGEIVASRLEWLPTHAGDSPDSNFGRYQSGRGQVVQGKREFLLVLPPVKTGFCLRSQLQTVDQQGGHGLLVLARGEVTPVMGELVTLDLKVTAPPDVSNPAPEEGEKDGAASKTGK